MARNDDSARDDQDQDQDKDREIERYRQAMEDALQQLDWCIGYLHGIRKHEVSKALAKNRSFIRRELLDQPEQPLPSEQTEQA